MKPSLIATILLSLSALQADAQDFTIFHAGKRTVFQPDLSQIAVQFSEDGVKAAQADQQETQITLPQRWAQIRSLKDSSVKIGLPALARNKVAAHLNRAKVDFAAPVLRTPEGDEVVPTASILLKLNPGQDIASFLQAQRIASITEARKISSDGIHELTTNLRDGAAVMDLAANLATRPGVKLAVPNFMRKATAQREATDPDFTNFISWGLVNRVIFPGMDGFDMSATKAWDVTIGRSSVIVAVFDGGIQQDHPEINQVRGVSTSIFHPENGDANPAPQPGHDHGIQVASCISGKIDNDIGSSGIAPGVRCISVRWCTPTMLPGQDRPVLFGLDGDIISGLTQATEAGARISVHSYKFLWASPGVEEAFARAREQGMIHFAAAGNDALTIADFSTNSSINFPASSPSVLCVGAADINGNRAGFSQFGKDTSRNATGVDFMAPGDSVAVMGRTGMPNMSDTRAVAGSGTSFAAPYAAGVAALILSVKPDLTPQQVENLMIAGCRDMTASGWDRRTGFGLVNAFASLPDDHGNTTDLATSISATDSIRGYLNRTSDVDTFKFTLSDFSRIKIYTTGNVNTQGEIRHASSNRLAGFNVRQLDASAFAGWTSGNFRTDIALEPGTYIVRISRVQGPMGSYRLHTLREDSFPEIEVLGNSLSITDGDETPVLADHTSFGSVRSGSSLTRIFTIRNSGENILRITNSTNIDDRRLGGGFSGNVADELNQAHGGVSTPSQSSNHNLPNPAAPGGDSIKRQLIEINNRAIKISQSPSFEVLPGRTTTFSVRFAPTTGGFFSQKLTIQSNDADEGTFDFMVSGSCIAPTMIPR